MPARRRDRPRRGPGGTGRAASRRARSWRRDAACWCSASAIRSRSAPCAMPSATAPMWVENWNSGAPNNARRAKGSPRKRSNVHSSATTASRISMSWLPVPRRPAVRQVSWMVHAAAGSTAQRSMRRARHRPWHRLAAAGHHAVAEQPARVLAAAGEAPASAHAIAALAAVDRLGEAARRERAADDDVGPVGVDRVEGRFRQEREELRRLAADHRGPAHRAVGGRELGEDLDARSESRSRARPSGAAGACGRSRSSRAARPGPAAVASLPRSPLTARAIAGASSRTAPSRRSAAPPSSSDVGRGGQSSRSPFGRNRAPQRVHR